MGQKTGQDNQDKGEAPQGVTPMMAQFLEIKQAHRDCLLFYRMGDFYELFFDDAVLAAEALNITLTHRGKHLGEEIPMCGVPVHSSESYLSKLIRHGFKVAICEQTEDPAEAKKRGSKSVVRREVVRLVTPGTISEDQLLDARSNNYLAALAQAAGRLALAWLDMSTGDFFVEPTTPSTLGNLLARVRPGELLLSEALEARDDLKMPLGDWGESIAVLPSARFDSQNAERRLAKAFSVSDLGLLGGLDRAEIAACGALLDYLDLTQKGRQPHLSQPRRSKPGQVMEIDAATRRNLELTEALSGGRKGSLLAAIDKTITGAGARLLAARLSAPLTEVDDIDQRLDSVQFFLQQDRMRADLRDFLRGCPDMERALSRLSLGRGGPRDLAALRDGLAAANLVAGRLLADRGAPPPPLLMEMTKDLRGHDLLVEELSSALAAELPLLARDGGFIAMGHSATLDELKGLRDESRRLIANLQARYAEDCKVPALKIKHNNVLGYFIEVSATNAAKMPSEPERGYLHRQTLASAVRYTTVELSELEQKIVSAADKALALELELFESLRQKVMVQADTILAAARGLAAVDVAAGLAEQAELADWSRPLLEDSNTFHIEKGRHPVVEAALAKAQDGPFVANDCRLDQEDRIWLVTGPNMAGKSTFLRQNAVIALLAQMGSYVPAETAKIGIVDRLFSRVGAADDLARGRSTFMVEMVETAAILTQAGSRALVILDEIGRGTATFDGLSIAWACVEHLHEVNGCRALFATHYHELTKLTSKLQALTCHSMKVKEWKDEIVFLHEVGPGAADRSYGIHVAKLAGLPAAATLRAEEILGLLESGEQASALSNLAEDLPLFAATRQRAEEKPAGSSAKDALHDLLGQLNPDEMTPREALEALYRLRSLAGEDRS